MFGLDSHTANRTCGVVIDIGSGSVGAAIVISDPKEEKPQMIWSRREYVLIKDIESTDIPLKEINTSIVNIFLQLGADGLKALHNADKHLSVTTLQVSISAPWVYTVTKTINFSDEHPFDVTTELIEELSKTAEKQAFTAVLENDILKENQLEIIDNKTIGTTINGYPIEHPKKMQTRKISLAHITAITQRKILTVVDDARGKVLPKANTTTHSFMYMFYDVLKHMKPDTSEACLIDITSEATEIGLIREGTLTHVTSTTFGTFSIAREIASLCKIPKEEAYSYLKGGTTFLETKLQKAKLEELEVILSMYEDKIAELFKTTGDALAIPKTLFLHCETATEDFFIKRLQRAAQKATTMKHTIHPVTSSLFTQTKEHNSALLLSAHYLHRHNIESAS